MSFSPIGDTVATMISDSPRRPRIGYLPWFDDSIEKGYTVRMRELLGTLGDVMRFDGVMPTWRSGRLDWLVVNWTDNDLLDRRTKTVVWRKAVKLFAKTIAWRLAARRLAFVRHNVYPHAVAAGHEARAARWVDRYERLFDVVLTHSGDDSQRPRHYCPHPLYHRVDGAIDRALIDALPEHYVVLFGRLVRYKRIAELIDAFPDDRTLVVIGAVGDRGYAAELVAKARANVIVAPGLMPEAEAQAIVSRSTALLIAHADADVVVSSSFFFGMSLAVPVLAVATPYLRWIAPRIGPQLLRLADDIDGLCRMLDAERTPMATTDAIEREFGDAAVRRALADALDDGAGR